MTKAMKSALTMMVLAGSGLAWGSVERGGGLVIAQNKLVSRSASASGDNFGAAVAMSGNLVVIGASGAAGPTGIRHGLAYVFDATTGDEISQLTPLDGAFNPKTGGDQFGSRIDIFGNLVVVGSPFRFEPGTPSGVYLFDATTGAQLMSFPGEAGFGGGHGRSVAFDGNRIAMTALDASGYVFDAASGDLVSTIAMPAGTVNFGTVSDLSGDYLIVGAPQTNGGGKAFLFDVTTGELVHRFDRPEDSFGNGSFGTSVAINGSRILIGELISGSTHPSRAHLYDLATFERITRIDPQTTAPMVDFGRFLDMNDSMMVITGMERDPSNADRFGRAYLYSAADGAPLGELILDVERPILSAFGRTISMSETQVAIIGVEINPDTMAVESGAYIFDLPALACPGDADNSGTVDLADLNIVLSNFGSSVFAGSAGDFDGSGVVDLADLNTVLSAFGQPCG